MNAAYAHVWQWSNFTHTKTCAECGLLPLDGEDEESDCEKQTKCG